MNMETTAIKTKEDNKKSVPDGYKRTEVGVIPEDWEVKPLRDIILLITNGFVGTVKTYYAEQGNGVIYVQGYNVRENAIRYNGIKYVIPEFHKKHLKSELKYNDLLTIQTGDIGISTTVPKNLEGANCHALIITRFLKEFIEPKFYSYYFNWEIGRSRLKQIETGSTMKHINVGHMIDLKVPVTSKAEQHAITTTLSDTDHLIESLDKLIAKKRAIKQAAMQQLLTGKTRLPGFDGEWECKRLGDLGSPYGGLTGKSKFDFSNGTSLYVPFMNVMSNVIIDSHDLNYVQIDSDEKQNKVKKGDLIFNGSSETPDEVGMCSVLLEEFEYLYLNSFCIGFRLQNNFATDSLYLAYFFRSQEGRKIMKVLAQGGTRYNLSKEALKDIILSLPKYSEQTAIAAILHEMDIEIEALERRMEKTKQIKQGMMQELLTGRIRLTNKS